MGTAQPVGPGGAKLQFPGVTIEIPAGAVPDARTFNVAAGAALGVVTRGSSHETFGVPIQVEHPTALSKPVRVSWDVSQLTTEQRASLILVRWDPALGVWEATAEKPTFDGDTLAVDIAEFSIRDWVSGGAASVGQTVGQWSGKRAEAPTCSTKALPGWVTKIVRPDEDQPAMPIRTCAEPDKNGVLTVRVANNRPYTQALELARGGEYAWTWAGEQDYTAAGAIRDTVNDVLSTEKTLVMAPARAIAVGLARPTTAGSVQLTMTAQPTVVTVAADILVLVLESVLGLDNVKGFDSEVLNTLAQTIYDCGGKSVLKSRDVVTGVPRNSGVLGLSGRCLRLS